MTNATMYAHSYEGNFVDQEFLQEAIAGTKLYDLGNSPAEENLRAFLRERWLGREVWILKK